MPVTASTVVLKFGSLVLKTEASLPIAIAKIGRHYRHDARVSTAFSALVLSCRSEWTGTFFPKHQDFPLFEVSLKRAEEWTGRTA